MMRSVAGARALATEVTALALAFAVVACGSSPGAELHRTETPLGPPIAANSAPDTANSVPERLAPDRLAAERLAAERLAPLASDRAMVALEVPGFGPATAVLPIGATSQRPLVLALHGNFDRPEWQCDVWRGIIGAQAFVLCPRGTARPDAPPPLDRWTYPGASAVRREIDAAIAALRLRYGAYLDDDAVLYTGFSLGAILGVAIVSREGARFPRAVLIEGGHSGWSRERASAFARGGGRRVLFACGQPGCRSEAIAAGKLLERAGIDTRVVDGGSVGHTYDGTVARAVSQGLPWLVADDPRWPRDAMR